MVEQGNDLHKTDAKLLEKIEELTLYSIQLEKQVDSVRQQLQQSDHAHRQETTKQRAEIDDLKRLVNQLISRH